MWWVLASAMAADPMFVRVAGGSGSDAGCALRDDRAMSCWGALEADMPAGRFDDVVSAGGAACARQGDRWTCWGEFGAKLREFVGDDPWVALWPHMERICGVRADGTVACTGEGGSPPADRRLTRIAIGSYGQHTCGLRADGEIECWGECTYDRKPCTAPPPGPYVAVTPYCGLRADGAVACWAPFDDPRIAHPPKEGRFTQLASSLDGDLVCALGADGAVTCWGDTDTSPLTPRDLEAASVSVGTVVSACAVTTRGVVRCWDSEAAFALDSMYVEPKEECGGVSPCVSANVRVWDASDSGIRRLGAEPVAMMPRMRDSAAGEPPPAAPAVASRSPAAAPAATVPAAAARANVSALETLKARITELEPAPWSSRSEHDWAIAAHELAELVVEVGDAPLRGGSAGGAWTCTDDCEQLFRGFALAGQCADRANDSNTPFYASVEGQVINWWWYRAAALAAHDPHLLELPPAETRSSIDVYLSSIAEGRLPPMPSPADVALVDGVLAVSKPLGWRGPKTRADPAAAELQPGSDDAVALIVGWLKLHPEVDALEVVARGHAKAETTGAAAAAEICRRLQRGAPAVKSCATSAEVAPADGYPLVVRVR